MDKDMAEAPMGRNLDSIKRLTVTGIKLSVVDKGTGDSVNYGVQLNNTTLEIEALPNLKVEVVGYSDMYEALKESTSILKLTRQLMMTPEGERAIQSMIDQNNKVLSKAEGR